VIKPQPEAAGSANIALDTIGKLYDIERELPYGRSVFVAAARLFGGEYDGKSGKGTLRVCLESFYMSLTLMVRVQDFALPGCARCISVAKWVLQARSARDWLEGSPAG
jgi:hypothetical protein